MVRFTHFFNLSLSREDIEERNFTHTSHFTTLHKSTVYQWAFEFEPNESSDSVIIQNGEAQEYSSQMNLHLNFSRSSPDLQKVSFRLDLTKDGVTVNPPVSVWVPNNIDDGVEPPAGDRINRIIEDLMFAEEPPNKCDIRISLILEIQDASFEIGDFPTAAPPLPLNSDFRYSLVLDKSCHDLRIECGDGVYTASRQALFVSCGYFRSLFNQSQPTVVQEPTATVAAINTVLVHAITGTFSPPERMTHKLLVEILQFYKKYEPPLFSSLSLPDALEKSCLEYLDGCAYSLTEVVDWMMAATVALMTRLFHSAIAIILSSHFTEFVEEFGPNTQDYIMEMRKGVVRAFDQASPM